MSKRVPKILFTLLIVAFCIYLVPRAAISFFYYPDDKTYGPDPWSAESVEFTAKDGTRLQGRFIPPSTGPADNAVITIIHVHGNARNMSARWPLVSWLPERNFNVFTFDYRGLGKSRDTPSQAGSLDGTQSAINVVRHHSDISPQRLVLFGQNIGGASTLDVIGRGDRESICMVILDSTFASYAAIANRMILGDGYLLDESYSSENCIASISPIPLLLVHGKADHVIPWRHSEKLYNLAKEPKRLVLILDGEHIDAFFDRHSDVYHERMVDFILSALNPQNQPMITNTVIIHKTTLRHANPLIKIVQDKKNSMTPTDTSDD